MGVDIQVSLTSYARCTKKKKDVEREILVCSNKECLNTGPFGILDKFCKSCGAEIKSVPKLFKDVPVINPQEICLDLFKERLFSPYIEDDKLYDYYVSNITDKYEPDKFLYDAKHCSSFVHDIPFNLPSNHMKWFLNKFKKDINKLEELYGAENVTLGFGLLNWVS